MIKILDIPTKVGNLTTYHDIELEDINCPFCKKPMVYDSKNVLCGHNSYQTRLSIGCNDCEFEFYGLLDDYRYPTLQDFHAHVKERINCLSK